MGQFCRAPSGKGPDRPDPVVFRTKWHRDVRPGGGGRRPLRRGRSRRPDPRDGRLRGLGRGIRGLVSAGGRPHREGARGAGDVARPLEIEWLADLQLLTEAPRGIPLTVLDRKKRADAQPDPERPGVLKVRRTREGSRLVATRTERRIDGGTEIRVEILGGPRKYEFRVWSDGARWWTRFERCRSGHPDLVAIMRAE